MPPIAEIATPLYPPPPCRNIFAVPRACPLGIASFTPTYTQSMCRVCKIHAMIGAKNIMNAVGWGEVRTPTGRCREFRAITTAVIPAQAGIQSFQPHFRAAECRPYAYGGEAMVERGIKIRAGASRSAPTRALVSLSPRGRGNKGEGVRRVSGTVLRCIPLSPNLSPTRGERSRQCLLHSAPVGVHFFHPIPRNDHV